MSNDLKISRDLAERLVTPYVCFVAQDELRALLAAPAVERQADPVLDSLARRLTEAQMTICDLKASPPAPVAAVVDETQAFANWMHEVVAIEHHNNYVVKIQRKDRMSGPEEKSAYDAWNARACIDKVEEMNQ